LRLLPVPDSDHSGFSGEFMMSIESAIALAIICLVTMGMPGPGILALLGHALSRGLRHSIGFITGMVCGDFIFLILVIGGLAVIAESFEKTFLVIRILAAAYLVFLGIKAWRATAHCLEPSDFPIKSGLRGFISGLLITLSNPKVIIFYIGILPGFIDLSALAPVDIVMAVGIVLGILVFILVSYAAAASQARTMLKGERTLKLMNRGSGSIMIGAGITIAVR
jgi:threonine/homoserine/homoserine lactone efflux protein